MKKIVFILTIWLCGFAQLAMFGALPAFELCNKTNHAVWYKVEASVALRAGVTLQETNDHRYKQLDAGTCATADVPAAEQRILLFISFNANAPVKGQPIDLYNFSTGNNIYLEVVEESSLGGPRTRVKQQRSAWVGIFAKPEDMPRVDKLLNNVRDEDFKAEGMHVTIPYFVLPQYELETETAKPALRIEQVATKPANDAKQVVYMPIAAITPGQVRYTKQNVTMKAERARAKGGLRYDGGKSILSVDEALPVVKTAFGYVLVDGHHETLASLALGATTIPVYSKEDLSNLTPEAFWIAAEKPLYGPKKDEPLAYPYALDGTRRIPTSFTDLQDDPNRYFAAIAARKCAHEGQAAEQSIGAEYPLWVKIGKDVPFIEFKISDMLRKHGINYAYDMGDTPPQEFVEKARAALDDELQKNPIPGFKLVKQRTYYLDVPELCTSRRTMPAIHH